MGDHDSIGLLNQAASSPFKQKNLGIIIALASYKSMESTVKQAGRHESA